jgi:menaquinone-dependent protoporphyrinogen oxidase
MNRKILVAYATVSGSTTEVAEAIGETLGQEGTQVDVRPIKDVDDISDYEAVVVGGPMIMGWHRDAKRFLKKYQGALSQMPVAYFMTALNLTRISQESVNEVPIYCDPRLPRAPQNPHKLSFKENYATPSRYLDPVLKKAPKVKPVSVGFFGGKLDYSRLNILHMLFVMLIIQAQPGDHRDWEAIDAWAAGLRPVLSGEQKTWHSLQSKKGMSLR